MKAAQEEERELLLRLARRYLEAYVCRGEAPALRLSGLPDRLQQAGASFVTLTREGELRGCIGSTKPKRPLAEDVAANVIAAACRDPRFSPVSADELADVRLQITVLTRPRPLPYADYEQLLQNLRPAVDGVILHYQERRGLLLPQVWRRIPEPARFLKAICYKAGIPPEQLQRVPPTVTVHVFQAQHFAEPGYREPGG
jgi:AmmeMemoRadiSam system protein A